MSGSGGEKKEKIFFFFFFFTDAEATFGFRTDNESGSYKFEYKIGLHHYDLKVLHYIRDTLNIGNVYPSKDKTTASFSVVSKDALKVLIAIFAKYNLNTTKHLDFLAFTSAYELYTQDKSRIARLKLKPTLDKISNTMNSKRVDFNLDPSHSLNVSAYWLLGFAEGDGSFYLTRNNLYFAITQKGNSALLYAIQRYLHDLAPEGLKEDVVHVSNLDKSLNYRTLRVSRRDYLEFVVIPFFDTLTFQTKKYLDYCDWRSIFNIYKKALHCLPIGKKWLADILSKMNNNRWSNSGKPVMDRMKLLEDIANLLSLPCNYVIDTRNGKLFIVSEQQYLRDGKSRSITLVASDSTVNTFKSIADCAWRSLQGTSPKTVNSKQLCGLPIKSSEGQIYTIKREDISEGTL